MEIRQLEYFLAVSNTGSFTRAAERLYVSQPAVTNAIRSLEDELGILLFDRNQKLATLTAEGKIFAAHVEQVMHGISQTIEEIDAIKSLSGGTLKLGISPLCSLPDLMRELRKFHEQYPSIKLRLFEYEDDVLISYLIDDKLDMAILSARGEGSSLEYLPLAAQEMVVCFNRRHPFHRKNTVTLAEIKQENVIMPPVGCGFRRGITATLGDNWQWQMEVSQIQNIKGLVMAGMGVALLPETICESDDELRTAAIEPPVYLDPLLAYKKNRHLSHAAEAFKQQLDEELRGNDEHE